MVMQPADELVKLLRQTEATTPERWEEELKAHSQWVFFPFQLFLDPKMASWTRRCPNPALDIEGAIYKKPSSLSPRRVPFSKWCLVVSVHPVNYIQLYILYIYINTCAYRCIGVYVYQKMHMCMHMYMSLRGGRSPKLNWRIIYFGILRLYWGLLEVGLDVL